MEVSSFSIVLKKGYFLLTSRNILQKVSKVRKPRISYIFNLTILI